MGILSTPFYDGEFVPFVAEDIERMTEVEYCCFLPSKNLYFRIIGKLNSYRHEKLPLNAVWLL
jgi:hypothetical protein